MIRIGLCFPGQGSQAAGMADGLLELPQAVRLLDVAAAQGLDLRAALQGGDSDLKPTEVAQPALYLVEVVLAGLLPRGLEVLGTAGHSVGEYAAVVAAGMLDPVRGMELVIERGRAMAEMREGSMVALLGLDPTACEKVCSEATHGDDVVVVANLNAPGQVVISGTPTALERATALAKEAGARRAVPLNVSGAFHSPLMAAAAETFTPHLDAVDFKNSKIYVTANADGSANNRGEEVRRRLRRQLISPVRWTDCIARLCGLGVDYLVEVGPGSVLTGLAGRIAPGVEDVTATTADEMRELPKRLGVKVR